MAFPIGLRCGHRQIRETTNQALRGEIGVLKYVLGQPSKNTCFLLIAHDDGHYLGALLFDDRLFCQQIGKILKTCTGRTIKEIGDLDLSHLL